MVRNRTIYTEHASANELEPCELERLKIQNKTKH